jgi:hypothetical protein
MGLLDNVFNSEGGRLGLGLLAAAGGRADGAGFGERLLHAQGYVDDWKQQKAKAEMQKQQAELQAMQMQQYKAQIEQQKKLQGLATQFATPATPMAADGYGPSAPASFDRQGYANALEGFDPIAGLQYQESIKKSRPALINVAEGGSLFDPSTNTSVFHSPKTPKDDSIDPKIKQYEYAKKGGYKGTFEQFVTLGPTIMAAAQAPLREAQIGNIRDENAYNLPAPRQAVGGPVSVTTPDGRSYSFPNQAAANSFKMKAGIR